MAHARTVASVLARLEQIDRELPPTDGVKWFNKLYLEVTQEVAATVGRQHEAAPGFLSALDVYFGNRYFDAFDAAGDSAVPADYRFHAWKPLFGARFEIQIAPVQFALAGMNAHINHDLAIGVVDTCAARHAQPTDDGPEHTDYDSVNGLIAEVERRVKAWMMTGAPEGARPRLQADRRHRRGVRCREGTRRGLGEGACHLVAPRRATAARRL